MLPQLDPITVTPSGLFTRGDTQVTDGLVHKKLRLGDAFDEPVSSDQISLIEDICQADGLAQGGPQAHQNLHRLTIGRAQIIPSTGRYALIFPMRFDDGSPMRFDDGTPRTFAT